MKRRTLITWFGLLCASTAVANTPLRVGDWEIDRRAVFTVAAAPAGADLHFIYAEGSRLQHAHSSDSGLTWSASQSVAAGSAPELAVDHRGVAHLVYEAAGNSRVEYRSYADGKWTDALDITTSVPGKEAQALVPRIVVDGANHVHVLYWTLWKDKDYKPGSRAAYWRKPDGASAFEAPTLFSHQREGGNARHGALAVDPAGDLHVFYASNNGTAHAIEHRVRHKDGTWGKHDYWRGHLVTDWCIGAAVTTDGVSHLSVQTKVGEHLRVVYANNRADPGVRTVQHDLGWESYETFTHLLAAPNGDLWIATGHLEHKTKETFEPAADMPNIGTWTRYDRAAGTWSPRAPLSSSDAINLDARRGNHPRLVQQGGRVSVFYAEKLPGGKWRHWQRRLDP